MGSKLLGHAFCVAAVAVEPPKGERAQRARCSCSPSLLSSCSLLARARHDRALSRSPNSFHAIASYFPGSDLSEKVRRE